MTDEATRQKMSDVYYDAGVSAQQVKELGMKRPDIQSFLEFSEKYEGVPFRAIWDFGGLEFCFSYESDFEKIGISGQSLATCMDGETDAIREVCRQILISLKIADERISQGETHLVSRGEIVNPTAVKAFILAALDARERYQYHETIPELYFLLGLVLFAGEPDAEKVRRNQELRVVALMVARAYYHKHSAYPSYRKLAKILKVAPSTVSRMFDSQEEFEISAGNGFLSERDIEPRGFLGAIYPHL